MKTILPLRCILGSHLTRYGAYQQNSGYASEMSVFYKDSKIRYLGILNLLAQGHLWTTYMTQLKWCLYFNTIYCPHDVYWVHIWPDMTYQWNSGYVSEMFCFVTYQYQLNISPKTGLMEKSVVSTFYMRIFDDICYRYCHYSTQNRVSVYSYTAIGHIQTLYMTRRWIPHPYLIKCGWC